MMMPYRREASLEAGMDAIGLHVNARRKPDELLQMENGRGAPGGLALSLRAAAIIALLASYMLPAAVVAAAFAAGRKRQAAADHLAGRLAALLARLGPTFVKVGQILGTRRDVLPRTLCIRLGSLQDSVPPMSTRQARDALAGIYGAELDAVFASIDEEPVASGSVACVYRGRLTSGEDVAIKLQRPGIGGVMASDLAVVMRVGALLARLPWLRGVPIGVILAELCDAVRAQLDFAREADSLERLRANLSSVSRVWVPRLYRPASRDRAIVMEFIAGLEPTEAERYPASVRKRFAATTLCAMYRMLFVDGFVHCDLHPGNLYFKAGGQVVVLDAGFSRQLSEKMRRLFAEFFMEMALGRGWRCAEIVIESAAGRRADADFDSFRTRLADLVNRNWRLPAQQFSLIAFATEMFELQRRYGLYAAPELVFPLLALLVIEGGVRDLDPNVDFQETAKPILTQAMFGAVR